MLHLINVWSLFAQQQKLYEMEALVNAFKADMSHYVFSLNFNSMKGTLCLLLVICVCMDTQMPLAWNAWGWK